MKPVWGDKMKSEIRKIIKSKRSSMDNAEVVEKSRMASKNFLESEIYKNAGCIMLYMPLGNETDTSSIINTAFCDGKKLTFPVTNAENGEITPYYAAENTEFAKGAFSVREPLKTEVADLEEIDVILVPGIAFDKTGARIGFGKGCYDRLLKDTNAIKVGFCYDFQVCEEFITEEHDIKMDFLVTESGIICL